MARVNAEAGGTLSELVWLEPHVDVTDVLTRRLEQYHEVAVARAAAALSEEPPIPASEATASIHEIEEGAVLRSLPPSDPEDRVLLRDRVLPSGVSLDAYQSGVFEALWTAGSCELHPPVRTDDALAWRFQTDVRPPTRREGAQTSVVTTGVVSVSKSISVSSERIVVTWAWAPAAWPADAWFCPEWSLGCDVALTFDPEPTAIWRYPIITVSKCPDGFEKIEQGTSVTPRWPARTGFAQAVLRPGSTVFPGADSP